MVGKYVHRAVLGGIAQESQPNPVDAASNLADTSSPSSDALTTLIERTVRKVLAEGKTV